MSAQLSPESGYSTRNTNMLQAAAVIYDAILELLPKGFDVIGFKVRNGKPVIVVQECEACKALAHSVMHQRPTPAGKMIVLVAVVKGCQVEWVTIHK